MKKVYIVVLNYNNWSDTIECLESILKSTYTNYQIVLVDNNSTDNSEHYIKKWLNGELDVWINPDNKLKKLSFPPSKKPLPFVYYSYKEAESGGNPQLEKDKNPIVFIQTGKNLGFAGGNNIGIKYALAKNDFEYLWLLNNDTVIQPETLSNLIKCVEGKDKEYGIFGTTLLYYDEPERIQALGGKFNRFFATSRHLLAYEKLDKIEKVPDFDYIIGASMLIKKTVLEDVGLLSEDYFIYYEEMDYAFRAKRKGYKMFICKDSIVFHKESVTIKKQEKKSSDFSDYYRVKNRIKITRKFNPQYLPLVYGGMFISVLKRIKRKQYKQALNVLKIMLGIK